MEKIYDPIGTFRYKKKARKVELNLGIYFPILLDGQGRPNKVKLKKTKQFAVKSNVLPAVLIVIKLKKQDYRSDAEEDVDIDLRKLEGDMMVQREEGTMAGESTKTPIMDIEPFFQKKNIKKNLSDNSEIKHIAVIVFHSNHKFENIKKCFKDFWKLQTRELEKSPEKIFDVDLGFARYYKDNCEKSKKLAPETSGGSILVGV